jgi:hypothetical protein
MASVQPVTRLEVLSNSIPGQRNIPVALGTGLQFVRPPRSILSGVKNEVRPP